VYVPPAIFDATARVVGEPAQIGFAEAETLMTGNADTIAEILEVAEQPFTVTVTI
jgi:hypothetical protein